MIDLVFIREHRNVIVRINKVNFDVIRALVHLHAQFHVTGHVSVDIPLKITRDAKTKNIETKRMKKDYRIVYDIRVIVED